MRRLAPISWEYVAGFTDGEGCIQIVCQQGKLKRIDVGLFQSEKQDEVLYIIAEFLDDYDITYYMIRHTSGRSDKAYPTTGLRMSRQVSVTKFLEGVIPYLIVKAEKAEKALDLLYERERLGVPLSHLRMELI